MVIEDDRDTQVLYLQALGQIGAQNPLMFLNDAHEAVEFFFMEGKEARQMPCLILLDYTLGNRNAQQLLQRFRSEYLTHRIPILVFMKQVDIAATQECYELGANSVLTKDDLYNKLAVVWEYWIGYCQIADH